MQQPKSNNEKTPRIKSKAWKFIVGFIAIIAGAMTVWYLTIYFSPEAQKMREAQEYLDELQAEYENDTYGGETPEETLALFIDALEKGDIELASKYFLPEDREEIKNDIQTAQKSEGLESVVARLKGFRLETKRNGTAFFVVTDDSGLVTMQATLDKNDNGVWKISDI